MFKFVDYAEGSSEKLEGFAYSNQDGDVEGVTLDLGDAAIVAVTSPYGEVAIYTKDIPNLIKALDAAYKYLTQPGNDLGGK